MIVRDELEILIPKSMRTEMTRVLHLSHQADIAMLVEPSKTKDILARYAT